MDFCKPLQLLFCKTKLISFGLCSSWTDEKLQAPDLIFNGAFLSAHNESVGKFALKLAVSHLCLSSRYDGEIIIFKDVVFFSVSMAR